MGNAFLYGQSGGKSKMTVERLETSQTWTVPAGVTTIYGWICGGGGGGNARNGAGGYGVTAQAGNSGSVAQFILNVTPGMAIPVVIGAGGTAGGGTGGQTSFGSYYTAGGGSINDFNSLNASVGTAYGAYKGEPDYISNGGSGIAVANVGQAGNLGSVPPVMFSGYCPLTDEIYCGGGCAGEFRIVPLGTTYTGSGAIVGPSVGGGGISGGYTANGEVPATFVPIAAGNGQAYGAGGGCGATLFMSSINMGTGYHSDGGAGANGVAIIGYIK